MKVAEAAGIDDLRIAAGDDGSGEGSREHQAEAGRQMKHGSGEYTWLTPIHNRGRSVFRALGM